MITVNDVKICGYVAPFIAAIATLVRLIERVRSRRYSYEDGFASLSLVMLVVFEVALFVHLGDQSKLSHLNRTAMYYIISQTFYGIVWTARLSILFTVIRITLERSTFRRILHFVAASYVVIWIGLAIQVLCICELHPSWKSHVSPQCPLEDQVPITQLITDIYADSILIIAPLRLLWHLESGSTQRIRLIVAFSASILTTISSLIHAYFLFSKPGSLSVIFTATIELSSSLFVCNLPILLGIYAQLANVKVSWLLHYTRRPGSRAQSHELSKFSAHGSGAKSIPLSFNKEAKHSIFSLEDTPRIEIDFQDEVDREMDVEKGLTYPEKSHLGCGRVSVCGDEVYQSKSELSGATMV